jgi:hypothetical protein
MILRLIVVLLVFLTSTKGYSEKKIRNKITLLSHFYEDYEFSKKTIALGEFSKDKIEYLLHSLGPDFDCEFSADDQKRIYSAYCNQSLDIIVMDNNYGHFTWINGHMFQYFNYDDKLFRSLGLWLRKLTNSDPKIWNEANFPNACNCEQDKIGRWVYLHQPKILFPADFELSSLLFTKNKSLILVDDSITNFNFNILDNTFQCDDLQTDHNLKFKDKTKLKFKVYLGACFFKKNKLVKTMICIKKKTYDNKMNCLINNVPYNNIKLF